MRTVFAGLKPNPQQFFLHGLAGLRIESAKGLIEQQDCGMQASVRAIANALCSFPPEQLASDSDIRKPFQPNDGNISPL